MHSLLPSLEEWCSAFTTANTWFYVCIYRETFSLIKLLHNLLWAWYALVTLASSQVHVLCNWVIECDNRCVCIWVCTLSVMYSDSSGIHDIYSECWLRSGVCLNHITYGYCIHRQSGSHGITLFTTHSHLITISKIDEEADYIEISELSGCEVLNLQHNTA